MRRHWSLLIAVFLAGLCLVLALPAAAFAAPAQKPLAATSIPKFVDPLPILDVTKASNGSIQTILAGTSQLQIDMKEFRAKMLPHTFKPASGGSYSGTWVWGYLKAGTDATVPRDTYTGPLVVATRDVPTQIKFVNKLGTTVSTHVLFYNAATDQSLHWANPYGVDMYIPYKDPLNPLLKWIGNPTHYTGPIPAAVHLHGGEVPAALDGGPESWFTSAGKHGSGYYSKDGNKTGNYAIYRYPNVQEAAPLWFHDHTLGATRLNVYAGLAGAYWLTDPGLKLPVGLNATGLRAGATGTHPADDTVIPLVVQDREFDVNGQLYFPAGGADPVSGSPNPQHKYWVPEFFGEAPNKTDTICVNGKVWPYQNVKAQRYSFLVVNGSNARTYELTFKGDTDGDNPTIWQIGTDGGYLDKPVSVDPLVVMPGERAYVMVDFAGLKPGTKVVLYNHGPDEPFDGIVGSQPASDPATTGNVMQFRVVAGASTSDTSFNPAKTGATIRTGADKIVRLINPAKGTLAPGVTPSVTREMTLVEIADDNPSTVNGIAYSGGPLEILLNNTKWTGLRPDETDPNMMMESMLKPVKNATSDGNGNWITERPKEGTTEVWEIVNMSMDAHPIHIHLAQFQLLNRQSFLGDMDLRTGYYHAYDLAFPGGKFIPGYGPPSAYGPATNYKYGGNPDVKRYLTGAIKLPNANEAGWKDTVLAPPGMVTRFVVRWAPTDIAAIPWWSVAMHYPFLPNDYIPGSGKKALFDYVWHCHIIDHEDNEMMRPDLVIPKVTATRTYRIGRDY